MAQDGAQELILYEAEKAHFQGHLKLIKPGEALSKLILLVEDHLETIFQTDSTLARICRISFC